MPYKKTSTQALRPRFSNPPARRPIRLATAILLAMACGIPANMGTASAQGALLPTEPVAPKNRAECHTLYERYDQIATRIFAQARQKSEEGWAVAVRGPANAALPVYQEASRIRQEGFRVRSQGANARNRCLRLVEAHERRERARASDAERDARARETSGGFLRRGLAYADDVTGVSGIGGNLSKLDKTGTTSALLSARNHLQGLGSGTGAFGHSSWQPGLGTTTDIVAGAARWDQLQTRLVKASLNAITDIHSDAVNQLESVLAALDDVGAGPQGTLSERLQRESERQSALIDGGNRGDAWGDALVIRLERVGGPISNQFSQALSGARRLSSQRTANAQSIERTLRAAMRPSTRPSATRQTPPSAMGRTSRADPCRQLHAQYQQVTRQIRQSRGSAYNAYLRLLDRQSNLTNQWMRNCGRDYLLSQPYR